MSFDLTDLLSLDLLPEHLHDGHNGEIGYVDVVDVFENGYCHVLALALHEATGWPIYSLKIVHGNDRGMDEHFLVADPDGNLLDVRGTNTPDEVLGYWNGLGGIPDDVEFYRLVEVDADYIWCLVSAVNAEPPGPAEALAAAAARILLAAEYDLSIAA